MSYRHSDVGRLNVETRISRWRKVAIDGDDWTWTGNALGTIAAATGKSIFMIRLSLVATRCKDAEIGFQV